MALIGVGLGVWKIRRDLVELRQVDKRIDAYAIVDEFTSRIERLEHLLTDERVKLQILELRTQRAWASSGQMLGGVMSSSLNEGSGRSMREVSPVPSPRPRTAIREIVSTPHEGTDALQTEILQYLLGSDEVTAKEVQEKIGRSREHTARVMNGLFQRGLVNRNASKRPYSYSITQIGRNEVEEKAR